MTIIELRKACADERVREVVEEVLLELWDRSCMDAVVESAVSELADLLGIDGPLWEE